MKTIKTKVTMLILSPHMMLVRNDLGHEMALKTINENTVELHINNQLAMNINKDDLLVYSKMFTQFHEQVFKN